MYSATPIIEWKDDSLPARLLVKLEYMNHPFVSGNKWWKLKYNLAEAQRAGTTTLLTFGGAYSNHIFATAAAAHELGLKSIGVIAGEEVRNPTLDFARSRGMLLHFITRSEYRRKTEQSFIDELIKKFGDFYLIPEGGTNALAVKGCCELGQMAVSETSFDVLCLPVGTGGTMAGIVSAMDEDKSVLGFASLKGASFLLSEVDTLLPKKAGCAWDIDLNYHFGGYAKRTQVLDDFIRNAKTEHDLVLDPVYTGKMMFGILDLLRLGKFKQGSTVLVLHTGGLQGGLSASPDGPDLKITTRR